MSPVWRSVVQGERAATSGNILEGIRELLVEAMGSPDRQDHAALSIDEIEPIKQLCDKLQPEHFHLQVPDPKKPKTSPKTAIDKYVRYQHIWEDESFSMGIFILPPGTSIPLHDHPEMSVISRVLYGSMHATACDFVHDDNEEELPDGHKMARLSSNETVHGPFSTELLPNRGNLHEFVAGEPQGCAIFDILTPPYDPEGGRDCTYYRIVGDYHDKKKFDLVELEAYEPKDFIVAGETYRGPPLMPQQ